MDFDALVARLRAERRPSWLVYRSAEGRSRAGHLDQCRDAWNLWPDDGVWWIVRGWGRDRTEERFRTEAEACDVLYHRVVDTGEVGVRAVPFRELAAPVRELIFAAGWMPRDARPGDEPAAHGGYMGLRVVETPDGMRVDELSVLPPIVGSPLFDGLSADDAARAVMIYVGQQLPTRPGVPRWGLTGTWADRLERLREVPLDRIAQAYLGVPEGVLDLLRVPAPLELLTDGLVALAESQGYHLDAAGGPDSVVVGTGDSRVRLARTAAGFVVERTRERSNEWIPVGEFAELAAARAAVYGIVRPWPRD